MSYLSVSDRMSAGLACRDWQDASLSTKYLDKQTLVISRRGSEDNMRKVVAALRNSHRPFHHFVFKEVEVKRNLPIWDQFGAHMKSLTLVEDFPSYYILFYFICVSGTDLYPYTQM